MCVLNTFHTNSKPPTPILPQAYQHQTKPKKYDKKNDPIHQSKEKKNLDFYHANCLPLLSFMVFRRLLLLCWRAVVCASAAPSDSPTAVALVDRRFIFFEAFGDAIEPGPIRTGGSPIDLGHLNTHPSLSSPSTTTFTPAFADGTGHGYEPLYSLPSSSHPKFP